MREVGVRELKASLSAMLQLAAGGERVRVTTRGRAIADIVPAGTVAGDDRRRALVAEGRLTPPSRPRPRRAPPLAHAAGTASELVLAERDAER